MILKGEEIEVIRSKKFKVAGVKCDICGKIIPIPTGDKKMRWWEPEFRYFEVTTGHRDWGNDSIESIEHRDICSDCIGDFVTDYLLQGEHQRSAYIDIETEHTYDGQTMEE